MKYALTALFFFVIGVVVDGTPLDAISKSESHPEGPGGAYLIGAATITDFERLPEYRAIAEPLAEKGGYVVIASGVTGGNGAELLEGDWPAEGLLFIERYDSMKELLDFANSAEFAEAKKLRDQVADVHFMLALESGERGTTAD